MNCRGCNKYINYELPKGKNISVYNAQKESGFIYVEGLDDYWFCTECYKYLNKMAHKMIAITKDAYIKLNQLLYTESYNENA